MKKTTIFTFIILASYASSCMALELTASFYAHLIDEAGNKSPGAKSPDPKNITETSLMESSTHSFVAVNEDPDWEMVSEDEEGQRVERRSPIIRPKPVKNKETVIRQEHTTKPDPLPTTSFPEFMAAFFNVDGIKKDCGEVSTVLAQGLQEFVTALVGDED